MRALLRHRWLVRVLMGAALFTLPRVGRAEVLDSDGSADDTQAKIDLSANGDVVLLPAAGSFSWSSDVVLTATRAVTLDLNGSAVALEGADGGLSIESSPSGLGGVNRVTNGSIVRGDGHDPYSGPFRIDDSEEGAGLRVDHIAFTGSDVLVDINGRGPGVMDSCTFTGLSWAQEFIHVVGWGASSDAGWTMDEGDALAGSGTLFYIEDTSFTQDTSSSGVAWIQGYYGCRIGIRHNTFDWVSVDMHGTAGNIGARWWEFYENQFDNDSPSGQPSWALSMRAGSGVIHDNTMAGGAGHAVSIGLCEEDSGYPADYQIGRGLNQTLDPAYVWSNGTIALSVDACDAPEEPGMVEIGRDVFESPRPGYLPWTYPHPLRGEGDGGTGGGGGAFGAAAGGQGGGTPNGGIGGGAGANIESNGPGGGTESDDGCGCELPGRAPRGTPLLVWSLVIAALLRLRQRAGMER